jgi:hypothetical protein
MKHIEDSEQQALFEWAEVVTVPGYSKLRDYMFAIPNGGQRNVLEAMRLTRLGVTPGVPDLFCMFPAQGQPYLPIELKKPWDAFRSKGEAVAAVGLEQRKWLARFQRLGAPGYVCYGWDQARILLEFYLGIREHSGVSFVGYCTRLQRQINN